MQRQYHENHRFKWKSQGRCKRYHAVCAYIQKRFPQHELKIINISHQRIKKIEKDDSTFQGIMDEVRMSDAVLWAFPLYLLLVPWTRISLLSASIRKYYNVF